MSGKKITMKRDENDGLIPVGYTFTTQEIELSGTDYNQIPVPPKAIEGSFQSASEITIGESDSAAGWKDYMIEQLPVLGLTNIYAKGSDTQKVTIRWTESI